MSFENYEAAARMIQNAFEGQSVPAGVPPSPANIDNNPEINALLQKMGWAIQGHGPWEVLYICCELMLRHTTYAVDNNSPPARPHLMGVELFTQLAKQQFNAGEIIATLAIACSSLLIYWHNKEHNP